MKSQEVRSPTCEVLGVATKSLGAPSIFLGTPGYQDPVRLQPCTSISFCSGTCTCTSLQLPLFLLIFFLLLFVFEQHLSQEVLQTRPFFDQLIQTAVV